MTINFQLIGKLFTITENIVSSFVNDDKSRFIFCVLFPYDEMRSSCWHLKNKSSGNDENQYFRGKLFQDLKQDECKTLVIDILF